MPLLYDDQKITIPNNAKKIICNNFERVLEKFLFVSSYAGGKWIKSF